MSTTPSTPPTIIEINNNNALKSRILISNRNDEESPASASSETIDSTLEGMLKFQEVNDRIQDAYFFEKHNYSTVLDIIAMYVKGQKHLYTGAKTVCEQRLNFLMLPAILITAICTILSLVLQNSSYGGTVVSSLNGFNAFLLTLINYFKLDARAEAHRTSAYKFDKLQSKIEFSSGKVLFLEGEESKLSTIINDAEKDVRDIKETNQFILPEKIRYKYPKLYNINIFAEVKKISNREMLRVNELKDFMNERTKLTSKQEITQEDKFRIDDLHTATKEKISSIIRLKDEYLTIDTDFEEELKMARKNSSWRSRVFDCLKN